MSYESVVSVVGPLLGALIGAGAALVGQRQQWRQDRKSDNEGEWKLAVQELSVRAQSLDMASHQAASVATSFSSLGGQLNRLIGIVTPLDPPAMFEEMNIHFEALNRAAAQLRMSGDQEIVKLTNAVMFAAASVIEAHHAEPSSRSSLLRVFLNLIKGKKLGDQTAIRETRNSLASAVRDLVKYTRKILNLPEVDLYATPEASALPAAVG